MIANNETLLTLDTETSAGPKKPTPIELRSGHDYGIVTTALTERVENLTKLSKKNEEAGYDREARAIRADATAIEHFILPRFRDQIELPVDRTKQFKATVVNHSEVRFGPS